MLKTTTKTIYPELVDNLIANSLEFVQKYTDYLFNIGSIQLPQDEVTPGVSQLLSNPDAQGIQSQANSFTSGSLDNQLKIALEFRKALRSNDPITKLKEFFTALNDKESGNINNDFIFYWYKKYQTSFDDIKLLFKDKTDVFFGELSDNIGMIANFASKYTDSVSPLTDLTNKNRPPNQIPVILGNKLSSTAQDLYNQLNNNTSLLQKNNLINIQSVQSGQYSLENLQADTTVSHGANLITDLKFYQDFYSYLPLLVDKISAIFDKTFSFVTYLSNLNDKTGYNPRSTVNNLQKINSIYFKSNVEGKDLVLDLLKNIYKPSLNNFSINDRLGVLLSTQQKSVTTTSINNKFLGKDFNTSAPTPISNSIIAQERQKAAAEEIKQPNKDIVNLNAQVQRLSVTPSTNETNENSLLTTINNKEIVKEKPSNNTSGKLPSASLGSPEISALASGASNLNESNPQAILDNIESANKLFCDFKLPEINQGDLNNLTSGDVTFNEKQLINMLLGLVPKVSLSKLDDYTTALKQIVESLDPEKIWKAFYSKLFECKNKKDY
jgi:hypothetical protein